MNRELAIKLLEDERCGQAKSVNWCDHIGTRKDFTDKGRATIDALDLAIEALRQERPKGEWEHHIDRNGILWERCSECGDSTLSVDRENINFCPNCGAKMDGEKYERAVDQLEHDILYESTFNPEDGSM